MGAFPETFHHHLRSTSAVWIVIRCLQLPPSCTTERWLNRVTASKERLGKFALPSASSWSWTNCIKEIVTCSEQKILDGSTLGQQFTPQVCLWNNVVYVNLQTKNLQQNQGTSFCRDRPRGTWRKRDGQNWNREFRHKSPHRTPRCVHHSWDSTRCMSHFFKQKTCHVHGSSRKQRIYIYICKRVMNQTTSVALKVHTLSNMYYKSQE